LTGGGSSEQEIETANWIKAGGLKVAVLPLCADPRVDRKRVHASGISSPTRAEGRAAVEVAHLRGHEAPAIFMKSPNAVGLSGTAASAFDGDFDTDTIQYKVRAVFGGRQGRLPIHCGIHRGGIRRGRIVLTLFFRGDLTWTACRAR